MGIPRVIREEIAEQMPEPRVSSRFSTFASAFAEIEDAAYNRRMTTREYVGRAALAFAVYDSQGEVLWQEIMEKEPGLTNLTRGPSEKRRHRGQDFGPWQIVRLR